MKLSDQLAFSINISAVPPIKCDIKESQTQSDPYKIIHRGNQSRRYHDAGCETEKFLYVEENLTIDEEDSNELLDFLTRVSPNICKQLELNEKSYTFKARKKVNIVEDEECPIHSLIYEKYKGSNFGVTGLSWNSTGAVLAIAYGGIVHENWCNHTSHAALWNISKSKVSNEIPDYLFESNSCIQCLSFHPVMPSLLACGNFSGEILIWTIKSEIDNLLAMCNAIDGGHRDAVTVIQWYLPAHILAGHEEAHYYLMVSMGSDGRIIFWTMNLNQTSLLKCSKVFQLHSSDQLSTMPKEHLTAFSQFESVRTVKSSNKDRPLGITVASFSRHDQDCFLVGTDSGGVLYCQIGTKALKAAETTFESENKYKSPSKFCLARFLTPINGISWSPFNRNLVAVCGAFQGIHVYNVLRKINLFTVDPGEGHAFCLHFSPFDACILAASYDNNTVIFFNLKGSDCVNEPSEVCGISNFSSIPLPTVVRRLKSPKIESNHFSPSLCFCFNNKNSSLIAASDMNGRNHIWNIEVLGNSEDMEEKLNFLENIVNVSLKP